MEQEGCYEAFISNRKCLNSKLRIYVRSYRELEILSLILENKLLINDKNVLSCEDNTFWDLDNPDEVLSILMKIGLLTENKIKLEKNNIRIANELVHKKEKNNILISEPVKCGNMYCFRGFFDTEEIQSDHLTDHLDGIIIFEVLRQAALATSILAGVSLDYIFSIRKVEIQYKKFIDKNKPYYIQAIPVFRLENNNNGYIVMKILQEDNICAMGYFEAYVFKNQTIYNIMRNNK